MPKKIMRLFLFLRMSGFDPKADAGGHPGMHTRVLAPGCLLVLPLRPAERRPGGIGVTWRHRGERCPRDGVSSSGRAAPPALLQMCCLVSGTS